MALSIRTQGQVSLNCNTFEDCDHSPPPPYIIDSKYNRVWYPSPLTRPTAFLPPPSTMVLDHHLLRRIINNTLKTRPVNRLCAITENCAYISCAVMASHVTHLELLNPSSSSISDYPKHCRQTRYLIGNLIAGARSIVLPDD